MAHAPHLTADQAARLVGGELFGDPNARIEGIAALDRATATDLSICTSTRHTDAYSHSSAGAVIIPRMLRDHPSTVSTRIVVDGPTDATAASIRIAEELAPPNEPAWGIEPSAKLGRRVTWTGRIAVGHHAEVGDGVRFGSECVVQSRSYIGAGARIGNRCHIGANVIIEAGTELGNGVVVKAGAVVGGSGFAFHTTDGRHVRKPHVGPCRIADDVEIGANATIDRGSLGETVVDAGTKIDNLVHIAHNVHIGKRCLIMAQVGVAGSTTVEDDVVLAGQAGLADHVHVEAGARVAAQGGVIGRIEAGTTVSGYPARTHRQVLRQTAALKRLAELLPALERLVRPT